MALQINTPLETDFGYVVNNPIWKMGALSVDVIQMQIQVVLICYIDVNSMNANKKTVGEKRYVVSGQDFAQIILSSPVGNNMSDVITNAVYTYVKANDDYFAGATDI